MIWNTYSMNKVENALTGRKMEFSTVIMFLEFQNDIRSRPNSRYDLKTLYICDLTLYTLTTVIITYRSLSYKNPSSGKMSTQTHIFPHN